MELMRPSRVQVETAVAPPEPDSRVRDQRVLQQLLEALDANPDKAAQRYVALRTKLVDLFRWRGLPNPEYLTDETMNRVARRLLEGELPRNVAHYAAGVARLVALEAERRAWQFIEYQSGETRPPAAEVDPEAEARWQCFEHCMSELPRDARELMLRYEQGSGAARIEARRVLAAELGIPLNALRIRIHRMRVKLEGCLTECMARKK
jgi:DNA-directed RNA polymerase specialized sigma24 family protein